MRMSLGKRAAALFAAAAIATAVAAGTAFAAPVLQPGVTSYPGMSGTCTNCHTYAKATSVIPVARVALAKPVMLSRPYLNKSVSKRGRNFTAAGYFSPTLASATNATVTISVVRRNAFGRWVAAKSFNETATVSATGRFKNKINYRAVMNITRLGKYRLNAKLVYLDKDGVSHTRSSWATNVTIKRK